VQIGNYLLSYKKTHTFLFQIGKFNLAFTLPSVQ
jgi:hypothetical protein